MQLKNKVALITGASKGIGAKTAVALAKEGVTVLVNYKNDSKSAEDVVQECNKYSNNNFSYQADISSDKDVEKMYLEISSNFQKLDILINNAAIYEESQNMNDVKLYEKLFQVNFLGTIRITEQFLKYCKEGKIVNVSSIHGELGHGKPEGIAYASLKSALNSYTKILAKSLAPKILVNAVAPGKTLTPQWGTLTNDEKETIGDTQLIERFIEPQEVADSIVFLLKNDAVAGTILTIDGGTGLKVIS